MTTTDADRRDPHTVLDGLFGALMAVFNTLG